MPVAFLLSTTRKLRTLYSSFVAISSIDIWVNLSYNLSSISSPNWCEIMDSVTDLMFLKSLSDKFLSPKLIGNVSSCSSSNDPSLLTIPLSSFCDGAYTGTLKESNFSSWISPYMLQKNKRTSIIDSAFIYRFFNAS